ncbi:VOC family protein [Pantoea sp. 18069]|uniref:2-oxoadipate dioxygenase/decarboxylase HglS n=1 Tax=Pantoea sp. 18069 TaxID=2681415 RepID=UPI00135B39C7|nr:VOC family protein [Pantoea sp. 18069]
MSPFVNSDQIRDLFSQSMSAMYRQEVPQYGTLLELVADVNRATLEQNPELRQQLQDAGELNRIDVERHGAIRLGTAEELATMRRVFRVMGMHPVGYYDLSVAGVPVHATAFRPVSDEALRINPFRVFTSLLRLELIADPALRAQAREILAQRRIFTPRALELTLQCETAGGLDARQAAEFVREATQTFRWHGEATVSHDTHRQLLAAHRLVADVVSFKGPHINHLTPRTLDIDAAQAEMPRRGVAAKDVVEGPPRRRHPILLRQTSFKALEEAIVFTGDGAAGAHTARFGEIEQRGAALTGAGRALYDRLLGQVRSMGNAGSTTDDYEARLAAVFAEFPDDLDAMHAQQLAFFRYAVQDQAAFAQAAASDADFDLAALHAQGIVEARPIIYEDFLPVSAAGIFQSNLGGSEQKSYAANAAKELFEAALQERVADEIALYAQSQQASVDALKRAYLALMR